MKNLLLFMAIILSINAANAYDYNPVILNNGVKDDQIVKYCPQSGTWNENCTNSLLFEHHYTIGSGGYSEYKLNGKTFETDTCYEFLYGNKLIGYNPYKLKFYDLQFKNNHFEKIELTDSQIKELFPKTEIVKISQFKNDEIVLHKPIFKKVTFLFVNDTGKEFYKYQFENYKNQTEFIHGIFEPKHAETYIYSHFGGRDKEIPPLKIVVKNKLF